MRYNAREEAVLLTYGDAYFSDSKIVHPKGGQVLQNTAQSLMHINIIHTFSGKNIKSTYFF
jgi:hypothetical protein